MYVKGASTFVPGVALLPDTGNNKALFITAVSLLLVGTMILAVSLYSDLQGRKMTK